MILGGRGKLWRGEGGVCRDVDGRIEGIGFKGIMGEHIMNENLVGVEGKEGGKVGCFDWI
jgi:hypothetical protein